MQNPRAATLKTHFTSPNTLRPILTSLNGDNAWLLSLPRPLDERKKTGKAYFHIAHDPWLAGPDIQFASWVVHISLSSAPAASDGAGVEALVREIEDAAADAGFVARKRKDELDERGIDALLLTFHYGDHLHGPTLRTFSRDVKVFTTKEGEVLVRKLRHFESVSVYPDFAAESGAWDTLDAAPRGVAPYIKLIRVTGGHELNFLTAILWSHSPDADADTEQEGVKLAHEAILSSPHGLKPDTPALQVFLHSSVPRFTTLALLHGLKESWFGRWQTTFGSRTGRELKQECGARYWIPSHDDRLMYGGFVGWFITDVWGEAGEGEGVREVRNGECLVLE